METMNNAPLYGIWDGETWLTDMESRVPFSTDREEIAAVYLHNVRINSLVERSFSLCMIGRDGKPKLTRSL